MICQPIQSISYLNDSNLIISSGKTCYSFDKITSSFISSSTHHTGLIRFISTYNDKITNLNYLIATGEDKLLTVSSLPDLTLLSKRELIKRANALDITSEGVIVIGDKFGDVYSYPLISPEVVPVPKGTETPKVLPILGHVSMLNTLALIPATSSTKAFIATGDRDEHLRISHFPRGHNIEKFLWGSKSFVSALLYIPATSTNPALILSAGGDETLQIFNPETSNLLSRFPLSLHLLPHLLVTPVRPGLSLPNQKLLAEKKATKKKNRSLETGVAIVAKSAEQQKVIEENMELRSVDQALLLGMAVCKIIRVGGEREGGVVVLSGGSSALLYISLSLIYSSTSTIPSTESISLLKFEYPIVDISLPTSTSPTTFSISLDLSRGSPLASSSTEEIASLRTAELVEGQLVLKEISELEKLISISTPEVTPTFPIPNIDSMYSVLSLLYNPDPIPEETGDFPPSTSSTTTFIPSTSKPSKKSIGGELNQEIEKKILKRKAAMVQPSHTGKRAAGRAITEGRLEKARELAAGVEGKGVEKEGKEEK